MREDMEAKKGKVMADSAAEDDVQIARLTKADYTFTELSQCTGLIISARRHLTSAEYAENG